MEGWEVDSRDATETQQVDKGEGEDRPDALRGRGGREGRQGGYRGDMEDGGVGEGV